MLVLFLILMLLLLLYYYIQLMARAGKKQDRFLSCSLYILFTILFSVVASVGFLILSGGSKLVNRK